MHPTRASEALRSCSESAARVSFGDDIIDDALGGGIGTNMVTEISGEAGAGKTQVCLKLALQAQLPIERGGLGSTSKVFYLSCLEGEFPAKRLEDLATVLERKLRMEDVVGEDGRQYTAKGFLDNVITHMCPNTDDLIEVLSSHVPDMIAKDNIRLVIIDSVAGVVRPEFHVGVSNAEKGSNEAKLRKHVLFEVHRAAQKVVRRSGVALVVVNQVTSLMDSWGGPLPGDETQQWANGTVFTMRDGGLLPGNGNKIQPALGITWSHLVNERLLLIRDTQNMRGLKCDISSSEDKYGLPRDHATELIPEPKESGVGTSKRTLVMEFSPRKASIVCEYEVTREGLRGLVATSLPTISSYK